MSDSIDRVFAHALNTVKRIPRTGSGRPPPAARLKLYGLYKQSTEGDVEMTMSRPNGKGPAAEADTAKWDAWSEHHGLSRTESKRCYINTLVQTMHDFASDTPESRELISELEFVWEQVKSNSLPSSSSSRNREFGVRESQRQDLRPTYSTLAGQSPALGEESNLRMLNPMSEFDAIVEADSEDIDAGPEASHLREQATSLKNRRWRRRIELSLVRMTAELAALREQVEKRRYSKPFPRGGILSWLSWVLWSAIKHIFVDAMVFAIVVTWTRRRHDRTLGQQLQRIARLGKLAAGELQLSRLRQLLSRSTNAHG